MLYVSEINLFHTFSYFILMILIVRYSAGNRDFLKTKYLILGSINEARQQARIDASQNKIAMNHTVLDDESNARFSTSTLQGIDRNPRQ